VSLGEIWLAASLSVDPATPVSFFSEVTFDKLVDSSYWPLRLAVPPELPGCDFAAVTSL
jgi:hypothetical protein